MFLEKVQYALIYKLYKSGVYKTGKAYIYRANQTISIPLATLLCGVLLITTNFSLHPLYVAGIFIVMSAILFGLLEKNVSKRKLFKYRQTYLNKGKYLKPFYIVILSGLLIFALFAIRHKIS